jgi:methionyl-tRNA formyltransferase
VVRLNTVFLGSGEFSRDLLRDLLRAGLSISAVITRPDHPAGRGLRQRSTPVKTLAEHEGMRVFQPDGPGDPLFMDALDESRTEMIVVADYGHLLPRHILEYTATGCLNVHPSLLPRYRGAAPIQRALMQGERVTGVTLMLLDEGMDTGDIIACEESSIDESDNALSLRGKLASLGARMLVETLPLFLSGAITPVAQDETMATYADPIGKTDTIIDWTRAAENIHNQIRALSPRPGAYTRFRGKRVKILRSLPCRDLSEAAPGRLVLDGKDGLLVGTTAGELQLLELQPEGKKAMGAAEFRRGYRLAADESFFASESLETH